MTLGMPPPEAGTTRLILVRHGEPDTAVRGHCYGRLDPDLSPLGRAQMQRAWRLLDDQPVAAIYSSPSRRAIESARLRATDTPAITVDAGLREIDFGEFEGLTYSEIAARFPERYEEWMARPTHVAFPGGETFATMAARVGDALDRIRRDHHGSTVVLVSHGGVNRVALAEALALDPRHIFRLAQAFACVNVIDHVGDQPIVRVMNATVPEPC